MSLAHWPAFWLFSLFHSFTGSPGSTADCQKAAPYTNGTADKLLTSELDVVEGGWKDRATGVNVFSGTVHPNTSTPCGVPDSWTLAQYKHTETGFHTYGALWTPTTVSWFYDDVFRGSCAAPPSFYQPMFLVLSSVRHNDAADKPAMLDTQVDWVRVWQDSSCKRWNA
jgi:beta-glucanase (GH16 family)